MTCNQHDATYYTTQQAGNTEWVCWSQLASQMAPTTPVPSGTCPHQGTTQLTPAPPGPADTQDLESDEKEQQVDSDAIYDLSFHQAGDLVLHDTTVYAAVVELLLELE
eukprot:scaffold307508_cov27-Tisochrysis_lutea.AAC.1